MNNAELTQLDFQIQKQKKLAYRHYYNGRWEKAIKIIDEIIKIPELLPEVRNNLLGVKSYCYLSLGQLHKGWELFKYRKPARKARQRMKELGIDLPEWKGETDPDCRLLIVAEDGLGDELMYTSYLHLLEEKVEFFCLECDNRLFPLLGDISYADRKTDDIKEFKTEYNKYVLMGDLVRYLNPCCKKEHWVPLLEINDSIPKTIGISYKSGGYIKDLKMPPPQFWFKLLEEADDDITFYNLQENEQTPLQERGFLFYHPRVRHFSNDTIDLYNDIYSLANIIGNLDRVYTIENYIAHLAGRIGTPSVVYLHKFHNCRWQIGEGIYPHNEYKIFSSCDN